jgi:hypothetical protein
MSINDIKEEVVKAVNRSKYQVNFIDQKEDKLLIEVERPTKFYSKQLRGEIKSEGDVRKFEEALAETLE